MRLLLDAMYPPDIAEALRRDGYDVVAAQETEELRGLSDEFVLRWAAGQSRAVVTENVQDFAPLDVTWRAADRVHYGLIYTGNDSFPRHRPAFIGEMVRSLGRFLDDHPEEGAECGVWWLERQRGSS